MAIDPARHDRRATVRALLTEAVDYAGLFPPASLPMDAAVANYAAYLAGDDAWALGRFVVPVARLAELSASAATHRRADQPWRISALAGSDVAQDAGIVSSFNAAHAGWLSVDMIEGKGTTPAQVVTLAAAFAGMRVFVEVVPDASLPDLLSAIGASGVGAKIRTGGVTPDAFPDSRQVARFIVACTAAGVPWKATAGLHHPVRGEFPLTYAPDAPRGTMFGYLNVFLAGALALEGGDEGALVELLEARDARALVLGDDGVRWGDRRIPLDAVHRLRGRLASFGSCSFREPIDELVAIPASTDRP